MNKTLTTALLLLTSAVLPAHAVMLGGDQFGNLFSINLTTGAGTLIGTEAGFPLSTEIEYDTATGTLYSEETNGNTNLHTISTATGLSNGFVTHGCCALTGMEFVGATLYATNITGGGGGSPSTLETVNTATGALTTIGATGFGPISGLAYDGTTMFGVTAGSASANLVSINLATGAAALIGALTDSASGAVLDRVGSIEFGANGILYGGVAQSGSINPNWLFSIDTTTGLSTFIGNTGFSITGLTSTGPAGMPEPGTLLLLGLGLVALGYRNRAAA